MTRCPHCDGEASRSVYVIFDGPPGPKAGRFVEVEDASGRSIKAGRWIERDDGLWALEIPQSRGDAGSEP